MAHPGDGEELRPRNRTGRGLTAAEWDERVVASVDDGGRDAQLGKPRAAVARGHDRRELAAGARRVVAALVGGGRHLADALLVGLEALGADHPEHADEVARCRRLESRAHGA